MRSESAFLRDIFVSASKIQKLTGGPSQEVLSADDTVQAAVLYHLIVIGEAVNSLPATLLDRYPEIPWHAVVALRNRVTHGYFGIDWNLIFRTVSDHIPALREVIVRMLDVECGELPPEV